MLLRKKIYDLDIEKYIRKTNDKEIKISIQELMSLDDYPLFKILLDNRDLKLCIKSIGYSGYINEDIKHYPLNSIKDIIEEFKNKFPDFIFTVTIKPLLASNLKLFTEIYEKEKEVNISLYDQLLKMSDEHKKYKI